MDAIKLAESLDYCLANDLPAMIWGDVGIGKTDIAKQRAKACSAGTVVFTPATYESVDLRGIPSDKDGKEVIWLKPDFIADLYRAGPRPVLIIDEVNTNKGIEVPLMQLILTRQIGPHKLPDGTRLLMTGNRMIDRGAANKMNKALEDRMFHLDLEASLKPWLAWAAGANIHPAILAFLMLRGEGNQDRPGLFICRDPKKQDQRSRPGPRAWASVSPCVDAPDSIRFGLIAGRVGEAAAGEFEGFLQVFRSMPPIPQIIAKPDTAPVPSEPSLRYAVSVALGHAANPVNLASVARYMLRVGKEFQIVTMTDAVRRKPELCETPAYIQWAATNADIAI